jgi:hypothetical protein
LDVIAVTADMTPLHFFTCRPMPFLDPTLLEPFLSLPERKYQLEGATSCRGFAPSTPTIDWLRLVGSSCLQWIRIPKHPDLLGLLVSEIEDLSTFAKVAFREGWLRVSRVRSSSCDDVRTPFDLPGVSRTPDFPGAFRGPSVPSWKPMVMNPSLQLFSSANRRGGELD